MKMIVGVFLAVISITAGQLSFSGLNFFPPSVPLVQDDETLLNQVMSNVIEEVSGLQGTTLGKAEKIGSQFTQDNHHGIKNVNLRFNGHSYCKFTPTTEKIGLVSNLNMRAMEIITKDHPHVPRRKVLKFLSDRLPEFCERQNNVVKKACDPNFKYRTIDGTCNNLQNPFWGSTFTAFDRLMPAFYEDGYNEARGGMGRNKVPRLPNVRLISTTLHPDLIAPHQAITNMLPQFGQFLDHDMTLTPESDKRCCTTDRSNMDCWPIEIFRNDPFFSNVSIPQTCMDFTRSTSYCFPTASGVREQMNIVTAFVDGSHVYHSEDHKSHQLREYFGGRFRVNRLNPFLLPSAEEVKAILNEEVEIMGHFAGGEERVNEMPALTTMHILLFREHNRLADEIRSKRPYWNDEKIFQEARRILIAEWQNVVYGEYLPIVLGDDTMKRYALTLDGFFTSYNPNVNPTIFHSFATAAYRFGHTLINGLVRLMRGLSHVGSYRLRDNFFNHEQITRNMGEGYDLILNGLLIQNAQIYDPFVTEDLTNFLLRNKENDFGGDLIARNLQRGRDHGLRPYNAYRQICHMSPLTTWGNRPSNIHQDTWLKLQTLYESPLEIDLFTGGISEIPHPGAISGSTYNCLKALQFGRAKYGDRFFFTHQGQAGSFTPDQVREIRKMSFGDMMCLNSKLEMTTMNVFKVPSNENPFMFCKDTRRNFLNIDLFLTEP